MDAQDPILFDEYDTVTADERPRVAVETLYSRRLREQALARERRQAYLRGFLAGLAAASIVIATLAVAFVLAFR